MKVKDHSVSKENFDLIFDKELEMYSTFPQPSADKLPSYYKSEDYISHTDSKRNLFEKVYHIVRKISLKRKLKLIDSFNANDKKILDIGCGTGGFLETMKKHHWHVIGIEPNEKARTIAVKKIGNTIHQPSKLSNLGPQSFDVITLWHVLEHLPNLEAQLAQFKKLLKHNGTLVVAVPNFKSYDALHYGPFWAGFDVPRHLWHFSQTSIQKLVAKQNMKVVQTLPMKFDSYYVSLLSEKIKNSKSNPIKAFYIGMLSNIKARRSKEYSSLIYIIKNS